MEDREEQEHRTSEMTAITINQLFDEDYYLFILKNARCFVA
jgi:hypothetical protein